MPTTRQRAYGASLALLLLTLAAYSNSFRAGFALDNRALLLQDPRIREASAENVSRIVDHTYWWPSGEAGLYRPLTTLSYLFNYVVLGDRDQPGGYHWINLLLHAANVLVVFALARKLIRSFWAALFSAAMWAVHPALTEAVTNIVGRADLLAGLGVLAGFLMYLKSTEGKHRIAWLAGVMLATSVGIFSKESAAVIVGVIALYEVVRWSERRPGRAGLNAALKNALWGILATLPPMAMMLYQRSVGLAASEPAEFPYTDNPIAGASFWTGRLTALKVIAKYLLLSVWPAKLSSDYSYPAIPMARGSAGDWVAWIIVAAALIGIVRLYFWNRVAFFWACFAAITFAPMANLLFPIGTIMAERFLYLPLIGVMACLAMLICALPDRVAIALLCAITMGFAARTFARNAHWHDDLTIAQADVHTNSFKLHRLLASSLLETNGDLRRAAEEADRSVALLDSLPDSKNAPDAYLLDGGLHLQTGDTQGAVALLEKCIAIDRAYDRDGRIAKTEPEAYRLLSGAYLQSGDGEKALASAERALELAPMQPNMYAQLAAAQMERQQAGQAGITLMAGMLLTSDLRLRDQLMKLYAAGLDTEKCAIAAGPRGPAINPACALVQSEMCAAAVEMIHTRLRAGERDLALSNRNTFVEKYGCAPEPLDQALKSR